MSSNAFTFNEISVNVQNMFLWVYWDSGITPQDGNWLWLLTLRPAVFVASCV